MDLLALLLQPFAVFTILFVSYVIIIRRNHKKKLGAYSNPDWNYGIKQIWARLCVKRFKDELTECDWIESGWKHEAPTILKTEESFDSQSYYAVDQQGNSLLTKICRRRHRIAEIWLQLRLRNEKVYQLPEHPNTVISNRNKRDWTGGGLQFTVLEPFRRVRISYNGLLRNSLQNDVGDEQGKVIHVQLNFIWSSCSAPYQWPFDQDAGLLSNAVAREPWKNGQWLNMITKPTVFGFDQYGAIMGEINVEGYKAALNLCGIRSRRTGSYHDLRRYIDLVGACRNGMLYNIGAFSNDSGLTNHVFGHAHTIDGKWAPVSECDIDLQNFAECIEAIPRIGILSFKVNNISYNCLLKFSMETASYLYGGNPWNMEYRIIPYESDINKGHGMGSAVFGYSYKGKPSVPECIPYKYFSHINTNFEDYNEFLTWFEDDECKNPAIVGGKAAALSLLLTMDSIDQFTVPDGFCLTIYALKHQLAEHRVLLDHIQQIEQISTKQVEGNLKDICDKTTNLIRNQDLSLQISHLILSNVKYLRECPKTRFAIRSSSVCEDSDELSAAGQNDTFLGCWADEDILKAVQKCWASLFSVHSVEYRRQHGQPINCGMGVIVQRMVDADVAGVLFTRHPVRGDPGQLVITANYGLGESVVSSMVEPDIVIVKRTWKNDLSIKSKTIGAKNLAIVLSETATTEKELSTEESKSLCLTNEQVIELAHVGITIEKAFGNSRDIEWAISKNTIYILQARPVTALKSFSDYELLHEFDTPILTDKEVITFANTGEVMPMAMSALCQSIVPYALSETSDFCDQSACFRYQYYFSLTPTFQHHLSLNVLSSLLRRTEPTLTMALRMVGFAVFGYDAIDENIHSMAVERNGVMGFFQKLQYMAQIFKILWTRNSNVLLAKELCKNFRLDLEIDQYSEATELFALIERYRPVFTEVTYYHQLSSSACVFYQMMAMSVLLEGANELKTEHLKDIGILLSSCKNVLSEIPRSFQEIVKLMQSADLEELRTLPNTEVYDWLKTHCPKAARMFDDFLSKHGHRGIAELDPMTNPWIYDSDDLLQALKMAALAPEAEIVAQVERLDNAEAIDKLKCPTKPLTRWILRFLISKIRTSVESREETKSATSLILHRFRIAYRRLAELMVKEGRLPDANLIHHLTHIEISCLLNNGNIALIDKALRRQRLYPKWNKIKFNEMNYGIPRPISGEEELCNFNASGEVVVKGTPVFQGTISGRACVITSLKEAHLIESGDILITVATDIAWSPYFPIISGIVTELGGLISHGAVVAREYGLPCIIGAQNATKSFKTGDQVLLSADKGEIVRLESPS